MAPLRVLITNRTLASRTGTELYVRDLAVGLAARGHRPVVYSPDLGAIAREIRSATIPVTDDLRSIAEAPDVIHGHHSLETMAALLAFPDAPAIFFCHSWVGWADEPLRFPRVLRHVAVDRTCRDRLCLEHGIDPARVHLELNSVELDRFRPRGPLPPRPRRALVFSNAAGARVGSQLEAIREACEAESIEVEVLGANAGREHARPEEVVREFDLVFAKGKSALEALAAGTSVILCDAMGMGPRVTSANLAELRGFNLGIRTLREPVTAEGVRREIAGYDAADAMAVSREIRAQAGADSMVDRLCALYEEVVAEHRAAPAPDAREEMAAAAAYLQRLSPLMGERDVMRRVFMRLLRTPVVGRSIRALGSRSGEGHWLARLLRMEPLG
ncbi:MAG TPA: glycosyltransferase family 4 protein [Longimicrobium sp.]|jgi:hypothetical protein